MRVATKSVYDGISLNLSNLTEELNDANITVATTKRVNKISDGPVGLTQALNIKSTLSNMNQLGRNLTTAKTWLVTSESALVSIQNLVADAKALAVNMASATIDADQRASSSAGQTRIRQVARSASMSNAGAASLKESRSREVHSPDRNSPTTATRSPDLAGSSIRPGS